MFLLASISVTSLERLVWILLKICGSIKNYCYVSWSEILLFKGRIQCNKNKFCQLQIDLVTFCTWASVLVLEIPQQFAPFNLTEVPQEFHPNFTTNVQWNFSGISVEFHRNSTQSIQWNFSGIPLNVHQNFTNAQWNFSGIPQFVCQGIPAWQQKLDTRRVLDRCTRVAISYSGNITSYMRPITS